jgi:hypothetical protein
MITRRHLLLAIAATCLVTMFLTTTVPIFSQTSGQYNPLYDVNQDGKIDGKDIALPASIYGTAGTPINLTALQSEIDSLNSALLALENTVATQQSQINNLGAELATKLGAPDYDSGWFAINPGSYIILTHNLGTTNVLVYMVGRISGTIDQVEYGGDANGQSSYGANWYGLTTTQIWINRMSQDIWWPEIRVFMWILPS